MNAPTPAIETAAFEAEQQLLGAVLLNNDAYAPWLKPEHFTEPLHRMLYEIMGDMLRSHKAVTPVTIKPFLPEVDGVEVFAYIASLAGGTAGPSFADGFASTIHDNALRLALCGLSDDLGAAARHPIANKPLAHLISEAEAALFDLGKEATRIKPQSASRTAGEVGTALIDMVESDEPREPPVRTGLHDLDRIIGGLRRGDLHILAGRPGMMKTGLASSLALNVARDGRPVLFFSKEMTSEALTARMLTDLAYVNTKPVAYKDVLDQNVTDRESRQRLRDARDVLNSRPIMIDPRRGLSVAEICLRTRRWAEYHRRKGMEPGAVFIDHLGKVRAPERDNRNLELGYITNALADEAGESNVPIVCLCQLSRAVEGRPNKRPTLPDLRESGHIEEDARVIFGLYREGYYLTRAESDVDKDIARQDKLRDCEHDLEIDVMKNSHGPTQTAKVWVHVPSGAIRDRWQS